MDLITDISIKEKELVESILRAYRLPGKVSQSYRYGTGHVNETYLIVCEGDTGPGQRFILQGISRTAFPFPDKLMENYVGITAYLRDRIAEIDGDSERETLGLIQTREGKDYFTAPDGKVWRLLPFVENTACFNSATPELFEASARAFGRFQYLLRDFPVDTLHETIPRFHDTEDRFNKLLAAIEADVCGRVSGVREELDFALSRREDCSVVLSAWRAGKLPTRVTHNDTKLNNVLFDIATGEGICIVDLDTTMPGLSVNDFGDSIRFGANHSAEDERDLSKVNFDIELYEVYVKGFLEGARGGLTRTELEYLPWGARLITLECGIRFLTDYLSGDEYFHTSYPGQNLDRCRTQFKLVRDMEEQFPAMCEIIKKYA